MFTKKRKTSGLQNRLNWLGQEASLLHDDANEHIENLTAAKGEAHNAERSHHRA